MNIVKTENGFNVYDNVTIYLFRIPIAKGKGVKVGTIRVHPTKPKYVFYPKTGMVWYLTEDFCGGMAAKLENLNDN